MKNLRFRDKQYLKVFIQIFLVVSLNIAISYLISEADSNLVSAQEEPVIESCLVSNDGKICQQYLAGECEENCAGDCIPTSIENIEECSIGICYDETEGICSPGSTKKVCEDFGGNWFEESDPEAFVCELGCCSVGGSSDLTTERECERMEEVSGLGTDFKPELDETGCWELSRSQIMGACILNYGYGYEDDACRFKTRAGCDALNGIFYEGVLCSYPNFNSNCEKQIYTGCVSGEEEVYWFDSCGNRENIYEGNDLGEKLSSWNNGKVKDKEDSCNLAGLGGALDNQDTCGNCGFETGTICGAKTLTESLDFGDVVCKDTSCIDEEGKRRLNGESWCVYQGSIEYDDSKDRATSTPGSRHFVKECRNGEIHDYPCPGADYRDQICTEYREDDRSYATCRVNYADLCIIYNSMEDNDEGLDLCERNPDCAIKEVVVPRTNYNFKACVPRYPKGFDLERNYDMAEMTCGLASLDCQSAKVKELTWSGSEYKWENKGCREAGFAKEMNDFCMSLGDCGASVNYVGTYEGAYEITGGAELNNNYIDNLRDYGEDIDSSESYIKSSDIQEIIEVGMESGIDFSGGSVSGSFPDNPAEGSIFIRGAGTWGTLGITGIFSFKTSVLASAGAFFTAFSSAVVGASLIGWMLDEFGITGGITATLAYTLLALGGAGAALTTIGIINMAEWGTWAWGGTLGIVLLAIAIVFTLYLDHWGIGEVTEYTTTFECQAWTPPIGGDDCYKCNEDGLGCSKYACESLGATCKFINEGTSFEECASIPGEIGPPKISPLESALDEGYEYEEFDNGFKIKPITGECLLAGTLVNVGINLSEPGRCTYTVDEGIFSEEQVLGFLDESEYNPEDFGLGNDFLGEVDGWQDDSLQEIIPGEETISYEGMTEFYFGGYSRIWLYEHNQPIFTPSLEQLGVTSFDPEDVEDFYMNIRCEDKEGEVSPDYRIGFCVSPNPPISAPVVLDQEPREGKIKADSVNVDFKVYTNNPSECKWSLIDQEYNSMENSLVCNNDPDDYVPILGLGAVGFECLSNVGFEETEQNKTLYVKCMDQPWLADIGERNAMVNSYALELSKTDALEILSIYPSEGSKMSFGTEPASIKAEVKTLGGIYEGYSECYYLAGNSYASFENNLGNKHNQVFDQYTDGEKTLYVYCEDAIGNNVTGESNFIIDIDNSAPDVVRAYEEMGMLKIETNEQATCYYDSKNCDFDLENGTSMTIGLSTKHSTVWENGKSYYIRCKDAWDNYESGCSKIIKSWSF